MEKNLTIRNSTAEFLIFQAQDKSQGVEVVYHDETIWATQKAMSVLFDCSTDNIGLHLKNIFASGELKKESVTEKISATASDGKSYQTQFYNLDAIISVGYRVNSIRATQFRQWCTYVLSQFAIRGYVIDKKRMQNGSFLGEDYFEHLLAEIREIRLSERRAYQKITAYCFLLFVLLYFPCIATIAAIKGEMTKYIKKFLVNPRFSPFHSAIPPLIFAF